MIKSWLINWVCKHLLKAVSVNDVITSDKSGNIYIGGKIVTPQEASNLREEARFLKESRLWHLMSSTIEWDAQQKAFRKSVFMNDVLFAKAMLYNLDVQNKIIELAKHEKVDPINTYSV